MGPLFYFCTHVCLEPHLLTDGKRFDQPELYLGKDRKLFLSCKISVTHQCWVKGKIILVPLRIKQMVLSEFLLGKNILIVEKGEECNKINTNIGLREP